jgi:Flp pilus assembly protein TadB
MTREDCTDRQQSPGRFQFSLLALLGLTTGCSVVFALVTWLGTGLTSWLLMVGGFCLVLVGDYLRREGPTVCGGLAMIAACIVLVCSALGQISLP